MTYEPMLVISNEDFEANAAIDVTPHIKQVQSLSYIPWGVSLSLLRRYNPNLAVGFEEDAHGYPYFVAEGRGLYLKAYVYDKLSGKRTPSIFFPVRDIRRKSSDDVDMATIGNQAQRAIAKVIAQETGIGWSLYSKVDESIAAAEEAQQNNTTPPNTKKYPEVAKPKTNSIIDF